MGSRRKRWQRPNVSRSVGQLLPREKRGRGQKHRKARPLVLVELQSLVVALNYADEIEIARIRAERKAGWAAQLMEKLEEIST